MISFEVGGSIFNYRVAGLAVDGDKVLLHRAEIDDFWSLPGGRVEAGESSREALVREMREEMGVDIVVGRLLWVAESFFEYGGERHHVVGLCFLMELPQGRLPAGGSNGFEGLEDSSLKLFFRWFAPGDLEEIVVKPPFLSRALRAIPLAIPTEPTHVVEYQ